jgi:hypothetical protein
MTWQEALEIVVARTKHERYRDLCSDECAMHEAYRALMIRQAIDEPELAPPDQSQPVTPCCGGDSVFPPF